MSDQTLRARNKKSYEEFQPPKRVLLGPGPSPVDDRVLRRCRLRCSAISIRFF